MMGLLWACIILAVAWAVMGVLAFIALNASIYKFSALLSTFWTVVAVVIAVLFKIIGGA